MKRGFTMGIMMICMVLGMQIAFAQVPPAPANLVAHVVKTLPPAVELNWMNMVDPWGGMQKIFSKVYRSVDDSLHFGLLGAASSGYFDKDVAAGHTYYYRVTFVAVTHDTVYTEGPASNIAWATVSSNMGKGRGMISGTVTDSVSGAPLSHALVLFFRHTPESWGLPSAWTDSLGHYTAVLDTGSYLVLAQATKFPYDAMMNMLPPYRAKWFKDAYELSKATPVKADSPASVADFQLVRFAAPAFAKLTGTVKDTSGKGLGGADVLFARTPQNLTAKSEMEDPDDKSEDADVDDFGHLRGVIGRARTDSLGNFSVTVKAGAVYIGLASKRGYLPQYYDHKVLLLDATLIKIPVTTKDSSGFDFNLVPRPVSNYSVAGIVHDSAGVRVPSHIILFPIHLGRGWFAHIRFGNTDTLGAYLVKGVDAGKYFVLALPLHNYAPAFYKLGAYGVHRWQLADTVSVSGAVTGIDIGVKAVKDGGVASLNGTVQDGSSPIQGVTVVAVDAQQNVVGFGLTDDAGAYVIPGVPAGSYTVIADRQGYTSSPAVANVGELDYSVNVNFTVSGVTSVSEQPTGSTTPSRFTLEQNYPNPFNPSTKIEFAIPSNALVTLKVFNALGQEVASLVNGMMNAGRHQVTFDATHLASGVYFYKVVAGNFVSTKKMVLLK